MGIGDFLKRGIQEMVIKRPDERKDDLLWKWPDPTIPTWSQLTVDADEAAVFFRDGSVVGTLRTAGVGKRHTLSSQNLPFLNMLMDQVTEGRFLTTALFFVLMRPKYNIPFGGELDAVRDPTLGEAVQPRVFGTFSAQIVDPEAFIVQYNGIRQGGDDLQWIKDKFMNSVASLISDRMENQGEDWFKVRANRNKLIESVLAGVPDLQRMGIKIVDVGKFQLNLDEQDEERIRQAQSEIGQAKRKADIAMSAGVREAEAKAKQRQFELDQEAAQRARYAAMAQGSPGGFAAAAQAEVMYGAGKGLAQGGGEGGGGPMMGGAGLGIGFGLAQQFAGGFGAPGAGGGYGGPPPIQQGSAVIALHPSGRWVPGRVVQIHGQYIGVQWDDPSLGQPAWLAAAQVSPATPPGPPPGVPGMGPPGGVPGGPPPGPPAAPPAPAGMGAPAGMPASGGPAPLAAPPPPVALTVGSLVLAQAPDSGWYAARIVQVEGGVFGVAWENPALGNGAWVQPYQVRPRQ